MKTHEYYRKISEQLPKRNFFQAFRLSTPRPRYFAEIAIIWSGLSFLMLAGIAVLLYQQATIPTKIRYQEERQLAYWESISRQQPSYPHAYYEIAIHEARLQNFTQAADNIQKALLLDPNFTQAEVFAQKIQNN